MGSAGLPELLCAEWLWQVESCNGLREEVVQPQQPALNAGGLGSCPPFLNGFPGGATGAMLGGAAQLFSNRVAAEAPHQEATPWSPHKLMGSAPGDSLHHHAGHHPHHPQQQPPHHAHVATAKLPWQSWTHHQT
ncbi:hypothetical protein V5799_013031 [Amblyomma americanum]|uniref:Uncharacterized protein n=1 Tax=Amblyomma americanum TaxID=6943 RepID=A0AAQ4E748_AMBAM